PFGLAQLHQLRGRIGRGAQTSRCVLLSSLATDAARPRMETMAQTQDGFVIAQRDLQLRGPGEILGTRQHGLPDLRVADLLADVAVLELARDEAHRLLLEDPDLSQPEHATLAREVRRRFARETAVAAGCAAMRVTDRAGPRRRRAELRRSLARAREAMCS